MNTTTTANDETTNTTAKEVFDRPSDRGIEFLDLDDGALLELVLGRSEAAWREFMRRFRRPVRGKLSSVLKRYTIILDGEAREDLMQDFYLRLLDDDNRTRERRPASWKKRD